MNFDSIDLQEKLTSALSKNSIYVNDLDLKLKPAAVLIPFVFTEDEWHLLFTKRALEVAKHQGEISFPGGAAEEIDKNLIETAKRESKEEIGLPQESIHVVGVLEPMPTISNFCVLPVVSIIDWPQSLRLNYDEVQSTFLIPINWLKNEENWYLQDLYLTPNEYRTVIHYKDYKGEHLWGITAKIVQIALSFL